MIPFPDKKYQIIYADPPWNYEGRDVVSPSSGEIVAVRFHYSTMTMDEISAIPVDFITDNDCLLFMWVSSPMLPECIKVGESWGFKYSTVAFNWYKNGTHLGNYTMSQTELCLVFKKGRIPQPRGKRNIRQFLSCKRGRHSEKPKEIRHRITEMFPTQDKIELFARPDWTDYGRGWDFWGNEVEGE